MKKIDLNTWSRKQHYHHFNAFTNPYFAVTVPIDMSIAHKKAKDNNHSFFAVYLHALMKSVNQTENFKYRIIDDEVFELELIHTSATMLREDKTFGFSYILFSDDFEEFNSSMVNEKERIKNSSELYPPVYDLNCIHCSALPWFRFSSQKEPFSGLKESIPKFGFSKTYKEGDKLIMNVSISANHALVDGYHVAQFVDKFQEYLNCK